MAKYTVIQNMPGYMPDSEDNVVECDTLTEARAIAHDMAQRFRDDWDDDNNRSFWRVSGNMHDGYYIEARERSTIYVINIEKTEE
jgi:hypothetical protein